MLKTLTITIEGKDYEIKEMTCGQVEDIQELLGVFDAPGLNRTLSKENARAIVAVAFSVDYPEVTPETIRKMRLGSVKRLNEIVSQILQFGGFIEKPKGEPQSGEAQASA